MPSLCLVPCGSLEESQDFEPSSEFPAEPSVMPKTMTLLYMFLHDIWGVVHMSWHTCAKSEDSFVKLSVSFHVYIPSKGSHLGYQVCTASVLTADQSQQLLPEDLKVYEVVSTAHLFQG